MYHPMGPFNKRKKILLVIILTDIAVLLPLIIVINNRLFLDIYFIFWFIFFSVGGISVYFILKDRLKEPYTDAVFPMILMFGLIFLTMIDAGVRESDIWFHYFWRVLKLVNIIVISCLVISAFMPLFRRKPDYKSFWRKYRGNKIFRLLLTILALFIIFNVTLFHYPILIIPTITWKADSNQDQLNNIVAELTSGLNEPEEKAYALLEWYEPSKFKMYNTWRPPTIGSRLIDESYISLRNEFPYLLLCVRHYVDVHPNWILTSQCGNCAEYARLYTEMAHSANLTVRTIYPMEMDHNWNEVLVDEENETWIIVDPSRFKFNPDPKEYENESGNFSYVYARRPWNEDQSKIDVTSRYTNVATVNITTVDIHNNSIPDVDVTVYSNNERGGKTELSFVTNETGYYQVEIGGGTITFQCRSDLLVNSTKKTLFENEYYDLPIVMEQEEQGEKKTPSNILLNISIVIIVFFTFVITSVVIKKKKNEVKSWSFVRNSCWLIGGGMVLFATTVMDVPLGTGGFAIFSLGFAIHSIVISLQSQERLKEIERKEIIRKLNMFQEENDENIKLIDMLIEKKPHLLPEDVLQAQMQRKGRSKYLPTPEEWKKIAKGGLWIPKEEFSYNYALQLIEISHHLDRKLIKKIKDYIESGRKLNIYKDFCQQWIIARRNINPDEAKNYYSALEATRVVTNKMKKTIAKEFKKWS